MKSVAARKVVAPDLANGAIRAKSDKGLFGVDVMQADVKRLVKRGSADRSPRVHEVASDLGLPINDNRLASEGFEINTMTFAIEDDLRTVVDKPLLAKATCCSRFLNQFSSALVEDSCTNAPKRSPSISARGEPGRSQLSPTIAQAAALTAPSLR